MQIALVGWHQEVPHDLRHCAARISWVRLNEEARPADLLLLCFGDGAFATLDPGEVSRTAARWELPVILAPHHASAELGDWARMFATRIYPISRLAAAVRRLTQGRAVLLPTLRDWLGDQIDEFDDDQLDMCGTVTMLREFRVTELRTRLGWTKRKLAAVCARTFPLLAPTPHDLIWAYRSHTLATRPEGMPAERLCGPLGYSDGSTISYATTSRDPIDLRRSKLPRS